VRTLRRGALSAVIGLFLVNFLCAQSQKSQIRTGIFRGMRVTYTWVPNEGSNGGGKAVFQGDIVLDHVESIPGPQSESLGVAYSQYLWPKVGTVYQVPYTIDPSSGDVTNLNTAISQFNSNFSGVIQFVPYTNQTDYVSFLFDTSNTSGVCEAYEGRVGGEQTVGGSASCTVATILHEMGHTVGVWHEQSRPDRNTYINVNYGAVIKASRSFFDQFLDNDQELTLYDYASVMQYPAYSFSRNGEPCIESIPAGIPLSNSTGYSAADIDGIDRLYGAIPTAVTVTSNPPGLEVIVDGATITTPQVYSWPLNSTHTLSVSSSGQTLNDINYVYGRWNDSTSQTHTITVTPGNNMVTEPATSPAVTVYSANFIQLVPYTNTVSPPGSGTVATSPNPQSYGGLSGLYYTIRQPVTLTATPGSGQNFYNFINSPYWLPGGNAANPKTFNVMDDGTPINLTTYFTSSPVYTVTTNPVESNFYLFVDSSGTYWNAPVNFALPYDSSWTPSSAHTLSTYSPQYPWSSNTRFDFLSWSDGGAETDTITLPSSGSATYTANLQPQYYVTDYVNESCAGSVGVSPSSPTGDGFYPTGDTLTFTETPSAGWTFTEWLYDLSGSASQQNLTVSDEVLVVADYSTTSTPLQLTSISPPTATAGSAGFTLTINGAGFTTSTAAYIGGSYRAATYVSPTQITVPILASDIGSAGAFQVAVGNFPSGASCAAYVPTTFYVLLSSGGTASVNEKTLAFGNLAVGTTSGSKTVTLTNDGTGPLSIGTIATSGDFSQTNDCATFLAAKSSCTVDVTFNPSDVATITGALTFTDSASTSPQLVKLTGSGISPLTFSPTSLTMPSTAVGSTSSASVTVTNKQSTAITLNPVASGDYSVTGGTCTSSLAAGVNCTITVTFAPQYKGTIKGSLAVNTNGAFSPITVGLSGAATGGTTPALTISPTSLTFTATGVGATSAAKTVTVTNKSSATVTIDSITASENFSAVGSGTTPCGGALAKSAKCTFSVTFTPTDTGSVKGSIAITDSGTGSPQIVGLSGTGVIPVALSPTSLTFASQSVGTTSAPQTVTLTNNSGSTVTISSLVASGDFTAMPSGALPCGETVAPASTCTFTVTFTPNVSGSISGAATVSESAPLSPAIIKLTGTGK
jgi:Astacin (Peptidase family M12A)/Abnormal spindle-like microcephaly-assoc'd, ASPM-SPD-2-Hydin